MYQLSITEVVCFAFGPVFQQLSRLCLTFLLLLVAHYVEITTAARSSPPRSPPFSLFLRCKLPATTFCPGTSASAFITQLWACVSFQFRHRVRPCSHLSRSMWPNKHRENGSKLTWSGGIAKTLTFFPRMLYRMRLFAPLRLSIHLCVSFILSCLR